MLIHLVYNKSLKRPIKKTGPLTYVMIDGNGVVYVPTSMAITSILAKDTPLASFEIHTEPNGSSILTTAKTFDELLVYFKDQFIPAIAAKDMQKVLRSQSLTIKYVIDQLHIPRTDAKEFIERCVNVGAFKKYYSYWIRTDIFSSWMSHQEGKS